MDTTDVIIHARFAPDGSVVEIGERPPGLSPAGWYLLLDNTAGNGYQALAGGRGVFRLSRAQVDALKAEAATDAA